MERRSHHSDRPVAARDLHARKRMWILRGIAAGMGAATQHEATALLKGLASRDLKDLVERLGRDSVVTTEIRGFALDRASQLEIRVPTDAVRVNELTSDSPEARVRAIDMLRVADTPLELLIVAAEGVMEERRREARELLAEIRAHRDEPPSSIAGLWRYIEGWVEDIRVRRRARSVEFVVQMRVAQLRLLEPLDQDGEQPDTSGVGRFLDTGDPEPIPTAIASGLIAGAKRWRAERDRRSELKCTTLRGAHGC